MSRPKQDGLVMLQLGRVYWVQIRKAHPDADFSREIVTVDLDKPEERRFLRQVECDDGFTRPFLADPAEPNGPLREIEAAYECLEPTEELQFGMFPIAQAMPVKRLFAEDAPAQEEA